MELLIILCLCVIAATKVTIQSFFAKKNVRTIADGVFFNGLIFLFAAVIFLKQGFPINTPVLIYGIIFGILMVSFQLTYINAMSCGNVSLTVMLVNFSMLMPITVSIVFYGERLTLLRFFGILLTFIALILSVEKVKRNYFSKKWFLYTVLTALINGSILICQKIFSKSIWSTENITFVAYGYIIAAILSVILYVVLVINGSNITFKLKPSVFLYTFCLGIILGIFQVLNTKAITIIDGTLLFPAYNGGSLIFSTISGVYILHDKLSKKQILSIMVGTVAIIMMNL